MLFPQMRTVRRESGQEKKDLQRRRKAEDVFNKALKNIPWFAI